MKVNTIIDRKPKLSSKPAPRLVEEEAGVAHSDLNVQAGEVDPVIFPSSDRFKHMLTLIARDNKELYNRIVGLE